MVTVTKNSNDAGPFWTFTTTEKTQFGFEAWVTLNENRDYIAVVRSGRAYRRTMRVYPELASAIAFVTEWVTKEVAK